VYPAHSPGSPPEAADINPLPLSGGLCSWGAPPQTPQTVRGVAVGSGRDCVWWAKLGAKPVEAWIWNATADSADQQNPLQKKISTVFLFSS